MLRKGEDLLPLRTRLELRDWLAANSTTESSCWILISEKPKPDTILYLEAVEEALCFGWIDGMRKKYSETELAQRLTPRRKNGNWTELNKERVRRLEKLGLMTDGGRKCLPDMSPGSFEIHPLVQRALEEDPEVYDNFLAFPELYRRVRVDTIQKELIYNHPDVFEKRLRKLIENTKSNKMYGEWHDDGRLLDY